MSSFELELIKKLEEKQNILSQKIDIIDINLQKTSFKSIWDNTT